MWQLLLRVSLKKDGLVLRLQNNVQTRSGITAASIEFLQSIITWALPIARNKWHDVDDQTVRKAILQWKRCDSGKAEWRTYAEHFLLITWVDWWLLWRFDVACIRAQHEWWTTCKHCFMTCNTILFVSRLIKKCFRRKFLVLFRDLCSLNTCNDWSFLRY